MRKYQIIFQDLLDKINQKELLPNTLLPTESQLMKEYDVSRATVRKSLELLSNHGYISKTQGKGSLVLDVHKIAFPVSGVTSFKEIQKTLNEDTSTVVNIFTMEKIKPKMKEELGFSSEMIYHIERVRKFGDEKVILDIDYINADIIKGLEIDHAKDSLYEYIEKGLGLKIGFARKEITVVKATPEEKEILDMLDFDLLVCVKSYTYLEDATPIQYTIAKHRPDKFRFVDFAKRSEL